MTDNQALGHT